MSEERKFEISEDILRALKIRRASVEADSETSQLMGDTEKTDRKRLCSAAAEEYEKGNYENAVKLWRTAAEYGDDYAQLCLAVCYGEGRGVRQDERAMFGLLAESAAQGNPRAQYYLAQCYEFGDGTDEDMTEAFEWYQKSAENDCVEAQYHLGKIYSTHKYLPLLVHSGGAAGRSTCSVSFGRMLFRRTVFAMRQKKRI